MPFISSIRGNYSVVGRAKDQGLGKGIITGGTITTAGGYRIHTFTSVGASSLALNGYSLPLSVEYLVVAGGGAGGDFINGPGYNSAAAGAGAGGYRTGSLTISSPTSVTVGAKGSKGTVTSASPPSGNSPPARPGPGGNSVFGPITSTGGGRGGAGSALNPDNPSIGWVGAPGGSGGGAVRDGGPEYTTAGVGNSPSTSPPQGNPGGAYGGPDGPGGGGGGAGGAGATTPSVGGAGSPSSISGSAITYASGGGGGNGFNPNPGVRPPGGSPLAGSGGLKTSSPLANAEGTNASPSGYGHGGGGAGSGDPPVGVYARGGDGSQGIVIARYLFP